MQINLEWDPNAQAAPQSFRDSVQAAANILDAAVFNPITVNIAVGYGEFAAGTQEYQALDYGESLGGTASEIPISYPALRAALGANASSAAAVGAYDALPATASLDGVSQFAISSALAKALGAIPPGASALDGYVGFPTSFTGSELVSTAITEEVHALGLENDGGDLGVVAYTSAGNHYLPPTDTGAGAAYFSLDGGATDLATYDVGQDETLFRGQPNDPLDFPSTGAGLTPLDLGELSAIGFDDTSTPVLPAPDTVPAYTAAAGSSVTANLQNVSVAENHAVPAQSMLASVSVPTGDSPSAFVFEDFGGDGGRFELDGVAEPDNQKIFVLDNQLDQLTYVGGLAPGSENVGVGAFDYAANRYMYTDLTATTTASAPRSIAGYDNTLGQALPDTSQPYTGPVAGLDSQFIDVTPDNINISASSDNWFIHSGAGEDAIAVHGGTNVLDGGTGSNFLVGAGGTDTFFVDDRGATADTWSTAVNFHAGDAATVWGVTPSGFALNWYDNQGAVGSTGLTLHATAPGKPIASLTLAGYGVADLSDGRLSVQFGTNGGGAYMFIHGDR